jgi:hypothetical protein
LRSPKPPEWAAERKQPERYTQLALRLFFMYLWYKTQQNKNQISIARAIERLRKNTFFYLIKRFIFEDGVKSLNKILGINYCSVII